MIPAIVERHAEDASFLWEHRERAVRAPHYRLEHVAALDERLDAHLDALRVAGEHGWRAAKAQLRFGDPGEVFAAAFVAFDRELDEGIGAVLALARDDLAHARAATSALAWCDDEVRRRVEPGLVVSEHAAVRRIALAARVVRRFDPGASLEAALGDATPSLRARALRAVGQLGRKDLMDVLLHQLDDADLDCRFAAAWSAALLGSARAVDVLRLVAEAGGRRGAAAADMAVRRMSHAAAREWITSLFASPEHGRTALVAMGALGDPELVPWLLQAMAQPHLARAAAAAFILLTGIDLTERELDGQRPRGERAMPNEDPEDDDVDIDPDFGVAWPVAEVVEGYWNRHCAELLRGTRYLMGKPMVGPFLLAAMKGGTQRQRAAAALELSMRSPGQPLYEVRSPGFRQLGTGP